MVNNRLDLTLHPRRGTCFRMCRASGSVQLSRDDPRARIAGAHFVQPALDARRKIVEPGAMS